MTIVQTGPAKKREKLTPHIWRSWRPALRAGPVITSVLPWIVSCNRYFLIFVEANSTDYSIVFFLISLLFYKVSNMYVYYMCIHVYIYYRCFTKIHWHKLPIWVYGLANSAKKVDIFLGKKSDWCWGVEFLNRLILDAEHLKLDLFLSPILYICTSVGHSFLGKFTCGAP